MIQLEKNLWKNLKPSWRYVQFSCPEFLSLKGKTLKLALELWFCINNTICKCSVSDASGKTKRGEKEKEEEEEEASKEQFRE